MPVHFLEDPVDRSSAVLRKDGLGFFNPGFGMPAVFVCLSPFFVFLRISCLGHFGNPFLLSG